MSEEVTNQPEDVPISTEIPPTTSQTLTSIQAGEDQSVRKKQEIDMKDAKVDNAVVGVQGDVHQTYNQQSVGNQWNVNMGSASVAGPSNIGNQTIYQQNNYVSDDKKSPSDADKVAAINKHQAHHMQSLPESVVFYDEILKPNQLPDVHPEMHEYKAYEGGPMEIEQFIPSTQQEFGSSSHKQPVSFDKIVYLTCKKRFIALVGPPGSGKTTLSKQLAKLSQPNQSAKFLLRFMDLSYNQPLTCKQLFVDNLCPELDDKTKENAFQWMIENQDKCVFVLDGFDQATMSLAKMKACNESYDKALKIEQLLANLCCKKFFKDSLLIFTSRPHSILKIPSELRPDVTVHVDDLSTENMKKLFCALAGDKADDLWDLFSTTTPQLLSLCHNPLLLQFIIFAVLHKDLSKVKTVTEVFQTVLEQLRYSEHVHNRDITKLWKPLGKMAYDGMHVETVVFTIESLGGLKAADVQDVIIVFARSLGFPAQRLFEGDQLFYFSHQTLQEIFAAKYICEFMSDEEFNEIIPEVAKGDHWSMVRRFLCGLLFGDKKRMQTTSCKTADQLSTRRQAFRENLIEYMKTDVHEYELIDLLTDLQECSDDEKDFLASYLPVKLNFFQTPISSSAAHALAEILPRLNRTVKKLDRINCDLNSDTLRVICGGISEMKHRMEELYLSQNEFGNAGVEIISGCLRKLELRKLDLGNCRISAAGLEVFCREIKHLDTPMEVLDLSENMFGNPGVKIISKCLRKLELRVLYLMECGISAAGLEVYAEKLNFLISRWKYLI
uniref:Uncharacterized protein LOC100175027 n=1 Tax=Phallusia mammillata TaxID=59560 RepID=A0A6F9DGD6_9ASCI|nr:uncharacterized protein LOC100175027 [Phallusia mammillata]